MKKEFDGKKNRSFDELMNPSEGVRKEKKGQAPKQSGKVAKQQRKIINKTGKKGIK